MILQIFGAAALLAGLALINIDVALIVGGFGLLVGPELLSRSRRPKGPTE